MKNKISAVINITQSKISIIHITAFRQQVAVLKVMYKKNIAKSNVINAVIIFSPSYFVAFLEYLVFLII